MFLDSFSHQWCQTRLFSMPVTVPPQPKHNNVCSRILSLAFSPTHYLQGCKWDVCVYQCPAACMEMHFPNSFQSPFLQLPYSCSACIFGRALMFLNPHGFVFLNSQRFVNCPKGSTYIQANLLKVLEQTATHFRFSSSVSGLLTCYLL